MRPYMHADPAELAAAAGYEAPPAVDAPALAWHLRDHPLRQALNNESHARPFATLKAPEVVTHLAIYSGETGGAADQLCLERLCERYAVTPPKEGVTHFSQDFGPFRLKWERHTEFATYSFFRRGPFGEPFRQRVIDRIARDWLDGLPAQLLVAAHVALLPREAPAPGPEVLDRLFIADTMGGSLVSGAAAAVYTDFRVHADGFLRVLIHDRDLGGQQAGRLVQRLLELEAYRMMALLALPIAREMAPEIGRCERELAEATACMAGLSGLDEERALLDRLTLLAAATERLSAATGYRFRATEAYAALVQRRIADLREERIPKLQTIAEFMDRRFLPAMRTCTAIAERIETVSERVSRASQLLHTRVGLTVQEQNRSVLQSVDRRAHTQVLLYEMVEGLSVVAIAYYAVGLLSYLLKGLTPLNAALDSTEALGMSTPVVFFAVWIALRHLRRRRLRAAD